MIKKVQNDPLEKLTGGYKLLGNTGKLGKHKQGERQHRKQTAHSNEGEHDNEQRVTQTINKITRAVETGGNTAETQGKTRQKEN